VNAGEHAGGNDPWADRPEAGHTLIDLLVPLVRRRWWIAGLSFLAGSAALIIASLLPPRFTATTTFLPPQPQGGAAAAALAQLGSLSSLAGAPALRTPADQYVALMSSQVVTDRILERFDLQRAWKHELREQARRELREKVRFAVGARDGLISVAVEDHDAQRAAAIANRYVEELRELTGRLALTEAQQRRRFFETQLAQSRERLAEAQTALQASGFNPAALRAEPRAAADGYARLKAEATATEVRLQALRGTLADDTPEVRQQLATLSALRGQLARLEQTIDPSGSADYVGRYREFKYQETLFELYARQFELARLDESREGALIQVIDKAEPPQLRSGPRRGLITAVATGVTLFLVTFAVIVAHLWSRARLDPAAADPLARLRAAGGRSTG
jgi:uncharacterized protein involved in exopolysaccharide biosynthesis